MPYNPISGQFEYGGESYDAPTAGVGMAMQGMGAVGADIPLAFRMMENLPGITAGAMFNARRFANTMFQGGFLDVAAGTTGRKATRAAKFGAYVGDDLQAVSRKGFLFGRMRDPAKLATKTPFIKPSRINNLSLRPRIFNRLSSVSALSGMPNKGFYTPFQGTGLLNPLAEKRGLRAKFVNRGTISAADDSPLFSGGFLGRMSTMSRTYGMERALAAAPAGSRRAARLTAALGGLDENLTRLGVSPQAVQAARTQAYISRVTTPARITPGGVLRPSSASIMTPAGMFTPPGAAPLGAPTTSRLRQISDTSRGVLTRSMTEYYGTMLSPEAFKGTRAFAALEQNIASALTPLADDGTMKVAAGQASKLKAGQFLAGQADDLGKFGVKSLSSLSRMAFASGQRQVGFKLAGAAGTRALGLAMPGLNVIGTASLVYDLTKMAGQAFISAGNLAKDAVKSMQGSLQKPLFGMGYKDNEVAATSRARGVMAIQNSRLNARSMLGSEAGMMAAHFG